MKEHTKQKLAFASDSVKQLITLATAVIALTVTFQEKLLPKGAQDNAWLLVLALVAFFVSALQGVRTLQGVASLLEDATENDEPDITVPMVASPAKAQSYAFTSGLGLLVAYLGAAIWF